MKAIIIARVSTEEQKDAGNSLPSQLVRMRDYCQRRGYQIVKEFSFDESAYKDRRVDFDQIVEYLKAQDEKIIVCFDKVDRLSRNIFDKRVPVLYEMAKTGKIELHFVSDGQLINQQQSAVDKFQFGINLGLAEYYSNAISDNVKRAQEQMLREGKYPGKAPYGYKNGEKDADGKATKVVDEYTSKLVLKAYELYATRSYSMDLLRKKMKEDYGVKWSKGHLDNILKNEFYAGVMTWNGKQYPHKYPHIVDRQLFEEVQAIKKGFNKKPIKMDGLKYKYRGLLRCGHCGMSITPEKHKGHVYYHCTQYNGKHAAAWLREEEITKQLADVFDRMKVPDEIMEQILSTLKDNHDSKSAFRVQQYEQLTKDREVYSKRIENLYMDKLDGCITADEYDKYYESFRKKLTEIDVQLSMLQDADDDYYLTANYLLDLANRAKDLFESSEVEQRRQLINLVLQNPRVEGKKVRYEVIKPFDTILDCADRQSWLPGLDAMRHSVGI